MKRVCFILLVLSFFLMISCGEDLAAPNFDMTVFFAGSSFNSDTGTLDFGLQQVGVTGSSVTGTVRNQGDESVTVTALVLEDTENYTLTPFELPYVLEPGASVDFSLVCSPVSSGRKSTTLTVTFSDVNDVTAKIDITGEGNAPPGAVFGIDVSGVTKTQDMNGFYIKDGSKNDHPVYRKSGETEYSFYYFEPDGLFWGINDDISDESYPWDGSGAKCYIGSMGSDHPFPPESCFLDGSWKSWKENLSEPQDITVKTGITKDGSVLKSNHHYSDEEGDAEKGTTYRWFKSSTVNGDYTVIAGAVENEISIETVSEDTYFKLEVTPADANGFTGEPVMSDPYFIEFLPIE